MKPHEAMKELIKHVPEDTLIKVEYSLWRHSHKAGGGGIKTEITIVVLEMNICMSAKSFAVLLPRVIAKIQSIEEGKNEKPDPSDEPEGS